MRSSSQQHCYFFVTLCYTSCVTLQSSVRSSSLLVSRSFFLFVLYCFFFFFFLHASRSFLLIISHSVLLHVTRSPWFVCIQKCFYCRSTASGRDNGACVQCCAGKCAVSFHVTCLVLAGFALEPSDWPQPTETYCERHQRTRFKVSSLCCTCNKRFSTE